MPHPIPRTIWERTPWLFFMLGLLQLPALIWRPFKIFFRFALRSFSSLLAPHQLTTAIPLPPIPQFPSCSLPRGPQGSSSEDRFSDSNWNFDFLREATVINLDNFPSLQRTAARMGRWGLRMFECDQDEDMADNIGCRISEETKSEEFAWVYFFTTGQKHSIYPDIDAAVVREKLDSGLGDKLFDEYRAEENDYGGSLFDEKRKYLVIVLGALMMRVGAKIREADIQHLRELVPDIPCREKWIYPLMDNGFRGPGKRQFLVALDHYQAGTPRCFSNKASCFRCGKMDTELPEETPLLRCGACEAHVWFCDEECQRWYWQHHNKVCGPRQREKGNV